MNKNDFSESVLAKLSTEKITGLSDIDIEEALKHTAASKKCIEEAKRLRDAGLTIEKLYEKYPIIEETPEIKVAVEPEKHLLRTYKKHKFYDVASSIDEHRFDIETPDGSPGFANFFNPNDPSALNKAIERGKEWVNYKLTSNPIPDKPIRKCRVCGCTEEDCSQCIEKTGKPCTWIEEDLCSACVPTKEEEPVIVVTDTRASQQSETESSNNHVSTFFEQLAMHGNVDFTMRIMKVNGSFTISITPGNAVKAMKPVNITGTPEEFDQGFFTSIMPALKEVKGLLHNIKEVKEAIDKTPAAADKAKKAPVKKKPSKPAAKKAAPKKPAVIKKQIANAKVKIDKNKEEKAPAVEEISLFNQPAEVIEEPNS